MTAPDASAVETPSGKEAAYENFPVGSFLIAPRHRPHVMAFYAFARAIETPDGPRLIIATDLNAMRLAALDDTRWPPVDRWFCATVLLHLDDDRPTTERAATFAASAEFVGRTARGASADRSAWFLAALSLAMRALRDERSIEGAAASLRRYGLELEPPFLSPDDFATLTAWWRLSLILLHHVGTMGSWQRFEDLRSLLAERLAEEPAVLRTALLEYRELVVLVDALDGSALRRDDERRALVIERCLALCSSLLQCTPHPFEAHVRLAHGRLLMRWGGEAGRTTARAEFAWLVRRAQDVDDPDLVREAQRWSYQLDRGLIFDKADWRDLLPRPDDRR